MNSLIKILQLFLIIVGLKLKAQENAMTERYGNTLNAGVGLGYYGYVGYNLPVLHADYEIQIDRNITLAPSITFYNYEHTYYWGNRFNNYQNYRYTETVIPIGIKTTYYFDQLLKANSKWDFYAAGSLGYIIRKTSWENGYYGETHINPGTGPLYLDFHVGTECHLNNKLGLQLDLSTGVSTFGIAFHL